jgi:small Trp-rich protein
MFLIIITAGLFALRYFEVGPFANMSWWWPIGVAIIAFIWFEFIERMLGLDKRASADENEELRKKRVKETFSKDPKKRR